MAITKKHERVAALRLELGKLISGSTITAWSYGGNTIGALSTGHALPYSSISVKGMSELFADNSIDGVAFADVPVQKKLGALIDGWSGNARYIGMDRLLYWMFGYEDMTTSPQSLGGGIYSHLFELDKYERELTSYRTAERGTGWNLLDRKNRYACIGVKEGPQDHRYTFAICNGFGFSSKAGEALTWNAKGIAYKEERGDYTSSGWTYASGVAGSTNMAMHHHLNLSMGPAGALVDLAVTDFSVNVDIPIFTDQDSESGLYIAEPALNGKYGVQLSFTLARHSVDTYLTYRDSFTAVCAKAVFTLGSYEFGLYFPDLRISDASVSEDDVARTPITFESAKEPVGGNPFSSEIGSHTLVQQGPIFCLVKNTNSTNEMRRE